MKFCYCKRKLHLASFIVAGLNSKHEALKELYNPLYDEKELKKIKNI